MDREADEKRAAHGIREQLLDAAEGLFAEQGVTGSSVREITTRAGANVAAVNYYFGSRDGLVREVIARRLDTLNEERLGSLSECVRPFDLASVLRALAAPSLRLCFEHPQFARLVSQLRGNLDRWLWDEYRARQKPVNERFQAALEEALPALPAEEVSHRLHYVLGAIQHQWAHCPFPESRTYEDALASFMTYHLGGLRAPAP